MRDFYHPALARGQYTPSILGLSASPIMKSKIQSLEYIEQVLHSKCVTPNRHRAELLQYVKMPELIRIPYQESPLEVAILRHIPILKSLKDILDDLDIMEDPWIINLQRENTPKARGQLNEALCSGKTNCRNQLKSLYNTAVVIARELGSSAANYYISLAISTSSKESSSWSSSLDLREEEKAYLRAALAKVSLPSTLSSDGSVPALWRVSDKVAQLIYALSAEEKLAGIVFVRQRATVAVLAQLLSLHPYTSTRFRVGKMVGSSANANQKASIAEPFDNKDQRISLDRFRNGELDLIIATSVLEEGIDVPACNLVVCFNEPENLKSFVQRRGRARKLDSKLVLLQSQKSDKLEQWQELETELKKRYADETREYQQAEMIENAKEHDGNEFRVLTTG
jgi:ERCC4-related helicase